MYPKGGSIDLAKVIGVCHGKHYKFLYHPVGALINSVNDDTKSSTSNIDLCELSNRRMAHMHHGALLILREITTSFLEFNIEHYDVCKGCAMGNYAKTPFPNRESKATCILDLIHTNVSNRMSHVSLSGYEYYVIFLDFYSKYTCIFFLKT